MSAVANLWVKIENINDILDEKEIKKAYVYACKLMVGEQSSGDKKEKKKGKEWKCCMPYCQQTMKSFQYPRWCDHLGKDDLHEQDMTKAMRSFFQEASKKRSSTPKKAKAPSNSKKMGTRKTPSK